MSDGDLILTGCIISGTDCTVIHSFDKAWGILFGKGDLLSCEIDHIVFLETRAVQ